MENDMGNRGSIGINWGYIGMQPARMENHMDKKMENEMETGV